MLQRSKSEIFILYKCRGMRRAIQSRYLNRFVKCLCVGFSKWSVYLCFLRTDMYVSDFDYGFLFLPPFYLRIAMFWQWYYFFFFQRMITNLTGGKLVFIVAQINITYLSSSPWFGPTTMGLETSLFSLGILYISTFFFFFFPRTSKV